MATHIGRKTFTRWSELDASVINDVNAALEKHGVTVFYDPGVGVSPGCVSIADDPVFAQMEAAATTAPAPAPAAAEKKAGE